MRIGHWTLEKNLKLTTSTQHSAPAKRRATANSTQHSALTTQHSSNP
ncbi:hypothetical protein H6G36_08790 [Anabaena minutissima FACHB-250]|nr:hypothetical protein [Anabaena minutissima FACHB-250]